MQVSLRRKEVEATGKPFYKSFGDVPNGLVTKTRAKQMKRPVEGNEKPVAYVLCKPWLGYLPLYDRKE